MRFCRRRSETKHPLGDRVCAKKRSLYVLSPTQKQTFWPASQHPLILTTCMLSMLTTSSHPRIQLHTHTILLFYYSTTLLFACKFANTLFSCNGVHPLTNGGILSRNGGMLTTFSHSVAHYHSVPTRARLGFFGFRA